MVTILAWAVPPAVGDSGSVAEKHGKFLAGANVCRGGRLSPPAGPAVI